jgi:hypothetical protein
MKKDKVYELRIEEDDEISGIDSISLVSEPAIEINWVAFNKVKPEDFHIPEGEDDKYIQKLIATAQNEQELFDEGWVVDSVEILDDKNSFISTNPNGPSMEDEKEYNVRYKYILKPGIATNPIIPTTRDFCKTLINRNYVWRVEDMDATQNDFGQSAMVWRGGYNCRHVWSRIKYKKDATITNKASVNKGKVLEGGFPNDIDPDPRVLGYPEPDTVTNKTLGNPSPSTIKNLGLSKEKMEIIPPNVNVYGYHTRFFQICPGAQATFEHLISMDNDDDTKGMIRSAAQVADNVFRIEDEVIKAESATEHQYEEAVILVDDFKDIIGEIDKISGMKHDISYMDGHIDKIEEYLQEDMGYDVSTITGYVDQGIRKKKKKRDNYESYSDYPDSVKNNAKAVLKYVEENGWGSCGTDVGKQRANQLAKGEPISEDTIRRMYSYLSRHEVDLQSSKGYGDGCGKLMYDSWGGKSALSWAESKINAIDREKMSSQKFQTDDEKRIVVGPAMVPDLKIFRKDKKGNPYYVTFKEDTIKMIADKYMRNKYIDNNDTEHNGRAAEDVYVYESWIKESQEDKSTKYGFGDLPIGTWFVSMKVRNPIVWERIKKKELNGFSVSGFFEEIEQFKMEQQFLKELAEILKDL